MIGGGEGEADALVVLALRAVSAVWASLRAGNEKDEPKFRVLARKRRVVDHGPAERFSGCFSLRGDWELSQALHRGDLLLETQVEHRTDPVPLHSVVQGLSARSKPSNNRRGRTPRVHARRWVHRRMRRFHLR